ncbi:hypothetical protein LL06_03515 [Hoeflea sp. BAL378]|uniref:ABC transporter ATP-binding protein n=1 Tax=Hoeflea sp. BAL378 TaxID=1547437 RepID=UPI000512A646|nr:ATP-binding cassette domain-containing protein [Hoeflea sp. BAL378]KGF70718.1 hypothetical protein LL06_03515 [Hoeflea sp. BAL378]
MAVLEATGLSKRFGGLKALSDVSFSLSGGEILGILGPNGAGKSTLINVVSGAFSSDAGRLMLAGRDIASLDLPARARAGLIRSFQNVRPSEILTVAELLRLAEHVHGHAGERRFTREQIIELCNLESCLDQELDLLAYGIQKIVNLAATALCRPKVLLLDEPFSGVSEAEIVSLSQIICSFRDAGVGIGLVEHNIGSVMALCDRVLVLDSGTPIFTGRPDVAARDEGVQIAYLGKRYAVAAHG